jgi:hypothetical protein
MFSVGCACVAGGAWRMDTATRKLSEVTVAAPTLLGKILIKAGTQALSAQRRGERRAKRVRSTAKLCGLKLRRATKKGTPDTSW